jgi:ubiquitin
MALITCQTCNKEFSENASACPHCAEPNQPTENIAQKIAGLIVNIFIMGCLFVGIYFGGPPIYHALFSKQTTQATSSVTQQTPKVAQDTNSNAQHEQQLSQCIEAAHMSEYPDGRCASGFIEACMTGSRQAMGQNLQFDRAQGMAGPGSGPCPNMPDTYVKAYNRF